MASAGTVCSHAYRSALIPWATISASGVSPSSSARSRFTTTTAAPPSEICEALPAVMVPFVRNAGFNFASDSVVASGRMPSSVETTTASPFRCAISKGTTSSAKRSEVQAWWARWCDRAAHASWSSREMPISAFTSSEESPMCVSVKVDHRPS